MPPLTLEQEFELLTFPAFVATLPPAQCRRLLVVTHRLAILRQATIDDLKLQIVLLQMEAKP